MGLLPMAHMRKCDRVCRFCFLDGVGICCMHTWDVRLIVEQITDSCAFIRSEEFCFF
jgi:hypothetical protein